MEGFFSSFDVQTRKQPLPLLPRCNICKLHLQCNSPKMPVSGKGKKKILIVGEAPGRQEDEQGRPFIGDAGQCLEDALRKVGVELRQDCWITNALRCRPGKDNVIQNHESIEHCRPFLAQAITELNPRVIILLGATAVQSLIGWLWKEDVGAMSRWAGWQIPCQRFNTWICPTYHPSYVMRQDKEAYQGNVSRIFFEKHLQSACSLTRRPWKEVPNYEQEVRVYHEVKEVRNLADYLIAQGKPVAVDIETDRLKPDHKQARIVCCGLSDGETSVAYPWYGEAITSTLELLRSNTPLIVWNLKFEHRWFLRHYKINPRNWLYDGMIGTHTLDNRAGICSLKFQAFVQLGQEDYDGHIKPYLQAKGSNERNRIHEVSLEKLMRYCAIDSLLEWKIGQIQMEKLGISNGNNAR